jgi:guanosine-3',5'-bis(diphosphate) 3'-pyrophosphohydrolase
MYISFDAQRYRISIFPKIRKLTVLVRELAMSRHKPPYTIQSAYQKAIRFAGEKHADQKMPASQASYLVHLSNVALEVILADQHTDDFDLEFAVQVALLHDVLEDTPTTIEEVADNFSREIAEAVLALSKNEELPADVQIPDSLMRIKALRKEVWAIKLADRIANMQQPPKTWSLNKRKRYRQVAKLILQELKGGNAYLESRLEEKIKGYKKYY